MQFDRRIQLYTLLPARPYKVTVRQLWERLRGLDAEFNVNIRTVERDLSYLASSRFLNVASDDAKPAGWYRDTSLLASDPI
ncbi:hypothetical protein U5801_15855 [Lamprobacter modestohalophilus]|uniref:WYL domain-containing protein n=1 Tax=Lamprobacter modestohalophilus TaxID=1064514 RepID=A0A9X0WC02_9GAMM|nr:hypothetical protein [Lamprobacter modestohalophilus]MBK1620755.1 hypothetical protein [Lamprobacter modestohalophilus]MEA1051269.1 hypothetical protein [Lamprobacter modestohalophilus]